MRLSAIHFLPPHAELALQLEHVMLELLPPITRIAPVDPPRPVAPAGEADRGPRGPPRRLRCPRSRAHDLDADFGRARHAASPTPAYPPPTPVARRAP